MAYRFRNDRHRTMEFVTEGVGRITGFQPADFTSGQIRWAQLAELEGFDWVAETERPACAGKPYRLVYCLRHKDGSQRWVSEQGQGIFDAVGTLIAFEGFVTDLARRRPADTETAAAGPGLASPILDLTERARFARQVEDAEARYRALLEALPTAAYTCDTQGRLTFFNNQAVALWGQRPQLGDEEQRFCGSLRLWRPDGQPLPHDRTPMVAATRTGASFRNQEVIIEQPDGRRVRVLVNIDPLRDADGRVVGAINSFSDITAQSQTNDALHASEERLATRLPGRPDRSLRMATQPGRRLLEPGDLCTVWARPADPGGLRTLDCQCPPR